MNTFGRLTVSLCERLRAVFEGEGEQQKNNGSNCHNSSLHMYLLQRPRVGLSAIRGWSWVGSEHYPASSQQNAGRCRISELFFNTTKTPIKFQQKFFH